MQDNELKLLYITSDTDALISINHTPVGQTGSSAISLPIGCEHDFFLSMQPLSFKAGFVCLPYTRRISLASGGRVYSEDDLISICFWPQNIAELNLKPLSVYRNSPGEIIPAVLGPFEFFISGEKHTAFIYNEAGSSFAVEHSGTNRLKYIYPLPFSVKTAEITLSKLAEYPLLCASGQTTDENTYLFAAGILPVFSKQICTYCDSFDINSNSVSVITAESFGQKKTTYTVKNSSLSAAETALGWFTKASQSPSSENQAVSAMLLAVKTGNSQAALDCLTPGLKNGLSYSDLKDFFGSFDSFAPSILPSGKNHGFALKYKQTDSVYNARAFSAETVVSDGKTLIDNITEI